MKGLVLAGGAGTRLRPLTYTGAKQLVPVANRPVLFYVMDNLADAGVRDIGVIVSPETGREVQDALGDGARWGARFTYILQERPRGLAHAVLTARDFLGQDAFCMALGDNLIGTMVRDAVQRFEATPTLEASVMLKEVTNPSAFGVAEVNDTGEVVRLVEKPKDPKSNLALVGIYLFRPSILAAAAAIAPSARGELEITDAISYLLAQGRTVRFDRVSSWWLDTGKKDDLLLANDTVLDAWLIHDLQGEVDAESKVTGRVRLGKGAKVTRSAIRGPVVIGDGAEVTDARIGPFTSLGDRVTVTRSSVEHCVVMEDSRVEDIARLEDSLIGRRVVVHPGSSRAGGLALLVGDDCRVELATRTGRGRAMRTLVFGAGFLGQRFASAWPDAVLSRADVTDGTSVRDALREHRPDAVVNAAGKTGRPNVDWCESHPVETYKVNVTGALTVAEVCRDAGVHLVHLGSGCVFYGASPSSGGWREDDHANPVALYSRTKYAADLVLSRLSGVAVARLRMPIDGIPGPRNLITKLASYREVIDVENSVTVVDDLVGVIAALIERRAEGVFHVTNPGTLRHRDLLEMYRDVVDTTHTYTLIREEDLVARGLAVAARSNCILASPRLAALGISMRPIGEALGDAMRTYARESR